jgi:S-adenosylmethionine-diacylgycerolhomoserine-N-methlytransferase
MSLSGASAVHADQMDRIYRWQAGLYDVTRRFYLLGREPMLRAINPPQSGSVLEIGCGTGRNLVQIGLARSDVALYGIDISRAMLNKAVSALGKARVSYRTSLALGDAARFDAQALFAKSRFDCIAFSYCLSMIPEWEASLEHAAGLLAPGGTIHIADFGMCSRWPRPLTRLLNLWLTSFHVTPRAELEERLSALASRHGLSFSHKDLFGGYALVAQLTRPC